MKERMRDFLRQRFFLFVTFAALVPHSLFAQAGTAFRRRMLVLLVIFAALPPQLLRAQSGTLGSASSPVVNAFGRPMGGVDVAICQPLATTAAQVMNNTAVLTIAGNPATAGFVAGMQIQVSGFSGGDAYLNGGTFTDGTGIAGGFTILSVTSTTITYALTHANATASSNGTVLQQGNATTACAGLSAVYSDPGMTRPITQPIVTDGYGNWNAFAQSGQLYYVQFYGSGVTTSMHWIIVNVTANAATKPQASDAVQYVSPNGNDTNDGLSIGSAKLTLLGAWNGLPSTGGTIYVSGTGAACTSIAGQGLGIAGSGDPNYGSMPEVLGNVQWVKSKAKSVSIQGLSAGTDQGQNATYGWATNVNCGNAGTPGLWLSGVTAFELAHIAIRTASIGVRIAIDSTGSRANGSNLTTNVRFSNDDLFVVSGGGPVIDGGGGLTWLRVTDTLLENGAGQLATSNAAAGAYFSNGNAATSLGLIYFDHVFFTGGGGVRFDSCTGSSGSFYMQRSLMEGSGQSQPLYEVIGSCGGVSSDIILEGGESDSGTNIPVVRVAAGIDPCLTNVSGIVQQSVYAFLEGPLTLGTGTCNPGASGGTPTYAEATPLANVIPSAKAQRNGPYGVSVNDESYRRSFAPALVRFSNLAAQNPASWVANNGTGTSLTQMQGPGDPPGGTNAATLSCTGNGGQGGCDYYVYNNNLTPSAGDYLYVGVWAQAASTAGFASSGIGVFGAPIGLEQVSNPSTLRVVAFGPALGAINSNNLYSNPYYQTDGNWQWIWALAKVIAPSGTLAQFKVHIAFKAGFPINAYAPMFVRIPASNVALVAAPTFSSASETGNTVTFTTAGAHGLYGAMPIVISGCSVGGYNGEWVITGTPSGTTFTLYNPATGLGSPSGCVITPGNDSEAADWANNLAPYGDNCTTGALCGIRGVTLPKIVASGTSTLSNSSIGAGACATVVTSTAAGAATTDRIKWAYASAPATADGLLTLSPYVTSGNVNWKLCNPTASSQTPSGLVVNWQVLR
jgi:hypothetical protein